MRLEGREVIGVEAAEVNCYPKEIGLDLLPKGESF